MRDHHDAAAKVAEGDENKEQGSDPRIEVVRRAHTSSPPEPDHIDGLRIKGSEPVVEHL